MANLEYSHYGLYFTEHIWNVIENGYEYSYLHFMSIFWTLTEEELDYSLTPECIWSLKILI